MDKRAIEFHLDSVYAAVTQYLGFEPKCYFAGGCIASAVLDEKIKDYDLWFEEPAYFEEVVEALAFELKYPILATRSKYAITLNLPTGTTVQFVESRMGVPEQVVGSFDFKHTQSYYVPGKELVYDPEFILSKKLVFNKTNFSHPVNTMQRVLKFARRGYDIPFETIQDLMIATNELESHSIINATKHAGSL